MSRESSQLGLTLFVPFSDCFATFATRVVSTL